MSIDIKIGNIYRTETDQLRQVTDIATDDDGTVRISYNCKSGNIPDRDFELCHTIAKPPSYETFKNNCGKLLANNEVQDLVKSGILKSSEII